MLGGSLWEDEPELRALSSVGPAWDVTYRGRVLVIVSITIIDTGELSAVGRESLLEVLALVRKEGFSRVEV